MTYINPLWYILMAIFFIQFALAVFVFIDAKKHDLNPVLWAAMAAFIPNLMGIVIYFLVRSQSKEKLACNNCGNHISRNDHFCSNCGADLNQHCTKCYYPVDKKWTYCPNCSEPLKEEV